MKENKKRYCPLEMAMVDEHRCADCKYGYDLPDGTIVCKCLQVFRKESKELTILKEGGAYIIVV